MEAVRRSRGTPRCSRMCVEKVQARALHGGGGEEQRRIQGFLGGGGEEVQARALHGGGEEEQGHSKVL